MKNIYAAIILFFLAGHAKAQPAWQWAKSIDMHYDPNYSHMPIATDNTGNIYTATNSWNNSGSGSIDSSCLMKMDAGGNELWRLYLTKNLLITDLLFMNNRLYMSALFKDTVYFQNNTTLISRGNWDGLIAKYDDAGNVLWLNQNGGKTYDAANSICSDSDNNIWVTGGFSDTATFNTATLICRGDLNMFINKYDSSGNLLFIKSAGSAANMGHSAGWKIRCGPNDNLYILGEWNEMLLDTFYLPMCGCSPYGDPEFLTMMNKQGVVQWLNGSLRTAITYVTTDIAIDANGCAYTTGSWNWTFQADFDVNKFDLGGNRLWSANTSMGYGNYFSSGGIAVHNNYMYVTCLADMSYYNGSNFYGGQYLLIDRYDTSGLLLHRDTILSDRAIQPINLIYNASGDYFLADGYFYGGIRLGNDSINALNGQMFLTKFGSGITPVLSLADPAGLLVYPNPSPGNFRLTDKFSDLRVSNLVGEPVHFTMHDNVIDLSTQAKGIYFVEALHEGKRIVRKIVLE